jgi:putative peptidoglycan lipid II flippase
MPASALLDCLSAAEIATGRTRIAALRPAILNISVISGIVLYAATGTLLFLPLLFALSFNILAGWSLWRLGRDGLLDWKGLRFWLVIRVWCDFARRLRPLLLQPISEQTQIWLERSIASGLAVGTLASLGYARTLADSVALLVSQPLGMAVLYKGSSSTASTEAMAIAGPLVTITLPASIYVGFFAPEIVHVVFARGAFNDTAVDLTSGALRGLAAGQWATMLAMILLRFLNNAGRNRLASFIFASAFATNALLNIAASRAIDQLGHGSLLLGLGEAGRGFVLLAGTAMALRIHRPLLRLLLRGLPFAVITAGCCFILEQEIHSAVARLGIGAIVCAAMISLSAPILMPTGISSFKRRILVMTASNR